MGTAVNEVPVAVPSRTRRSRFPVTRLAAIADQIVVSLTNFALTLAIGRSFSAEEFASFGIGLSIGLMVQGLQRHALTIPLTLQPDGRILHRHSAILAEQYIVLIAVLLIGLFVIGGTFFISLPRYGYLIALASLVSLVVYLQLEFSRAFLIKTGKAAFLLASSAWYGLVSLALAAAALQHLIRYETLLLVLGGAMVLHALALMLSAGLPAWSRGTRLLRNDLLRYGGWSAAATLTYSGYNHLPLLLLGAMAAPIHAAIFVATRSLMQPLQIIMRGLDIADKSVFARVAHHPGTRDTLIFTLNCAAFYAVISLVYCVTAGLFADQLVALAYGSKFAGVGSALLAWLPVYVLMGLAMPLESLVYARRDFRHYFQLRGLASILAFGLSIPLSIYYFETGAIAACAAGWLLAVSGTVIRLVRNTK
jgi:O-antigen/teichoic acid export membrane protein